MDEHVFHDKVRELMNEVSALPEADRREMEGMAKASRSRQEELRETVTDLQEGLDYLRLSIKYLMFDLEATRRENDYLRKMLEQDVYEDDADGGEAV